VCGWRRGELIQSGISIAIYADLTKTRTILYSVTYLLLARVGVSGRVWACELVVDGAAAVSHYTFCFLFLPFFLLLCTE